MVNRPLDSHAAHSQVCTLPATVWSCTSFAVGKGASSDGSVLITQSSDGDGTDDPRVVWVPPQTHGMHSRRLIFPATEDFPRYVGTELGDIPQYAPGPGQTPTAAIGDIPQVPSTFGYYSSCESTSATCTRRQPASRRRWARWVVATDQGPSGASTVAASSVR